MKHESEMSNINAKLSANAVSAQKFELLGELVASVATVVGGAAAEGAANDFKQQVMETMAVNKTFLTKLPVDEKVTHITFTSMYCPMCMKYNFI